VALEVAAAVAAVVGVKVAAVVEVKVVVVRRGSRKTARLKKKNNNS
jgi:hypothetical protein